MRNAIDLGEDLSLSDFKLGGKAFHISSTCGSARAKAMEIELDTLPVFDLSPQLRVLFFLYNSTGIFGWLSTGGLSTFSHSPACFTEVL